MIQSMNEMRFLNIKKEVVFSVTAEHFLNYRFEKLLKVTRHINDCQTVNLSLKKKDRNCI